MIDPSDPTTAQAFALEVLRAAITTEAQTPTAYLVDGLTVFEVPLRDFSTPEDMRLAVRHLAKIQGSVFAVVIVPCHYGVGEPQQMGAVAAAVRAGMHPEEMDLGRAIVCSLEHPAGNRIWIAELTDEGHTLTESPPTMEVVSGYMADLTGLGS